MYKPYSTPCPESTTVIIPVCDEDPELFKEVIERIVAQNPQQVLVVINGPRNLELENICKGFSEVEYYWTEIASKRNAIKIGVEKATNKICLIVDSDTIWEENALFELIKPFNNPKIGAVTTRQRIFNPDRNLITKIADWLENIRAKYSMKSMSIFGTVGCLPGRTIAFRTEILKKALPLFLNERFFGKRLEISDDRALTNYALKFGYKTVFQYNSLVYTDAPLKWKEYIRQQIRWAKGSQYYTLKMTPWMFKNAKYLAFLYLADIVTPFFLIVVLFNAILKIFFGMNYFSVYNNIFFELFTVQIFLIFFGAILSIGVRQTNHFRDYPKDIFLLPVFVLILTFILTPVRVYGFLTMGFDDSWGTRADGYSPKKESNKKSKQAGDGWKKIIPTILGICIGGFFFFSAFMVDSSEFYFTKVPEFKSDRVSLGVYVGDKSIRKRSRALEIKFNHILVYDDISDVNYKTVEEHLDNGYEVILTLTFIENYANLKDIKDGKYDKELIELCDEIVDDGRTIWLRPMHEFNGDWYNWCVFYEGNSKEDFIEAWKHIVGIFRERNAPVKFQINYNRYNGKDDKTPFIELYPGEEWVDMVVIVTYNRAYTDKWHQEWRTFEEDFDQAYNKIIKMTNKPIGIAELGTTSYGGNKPEWIINTFISLKYKYPRIKQITWFLYNRKEGDIIFDWDLNTPEDIQAFKTGIDLLMTEKTSIEQEYELLRQSESNRGKNSYTEQSNIYTQR